jgi:hypothetical protein
MNAHLKMSVYAFVEPPACVIQGKFGSEHLLDHRFQVLMTLPQPPSYVKHDDMSQSAVGRLLSTCIGSLGLWHTLRVLCVSAYTYV